MATSELRITKIETVHENNIIPSVMMLRIHTDAGTAPAISQQNND